MLLFFFILLIISIAIYSSKIKTEINVNMKNNELMYSITFKFYVLCKIKIFQIKFNKKNNIKKVMNNLNEERKKIENYNISQNKMLKILKNSKTRVKSVKLNLNIGTDNILITNLIIILTSIIIPSISNMLKIDKLTYQVLPNHNQGNALDLNFITIIEIDVLHILYTLYLIKIRRGKKEEEYARFKSNTSD